jgi:hypothetical protein
VSGLASGTLSFDDRFGRSAAEIGDLDGDGVPDALIGAPRDDDGASNAGAAYVLFLNADGTVKDQQKISATTGGLASGTLASDDFFGSSIAGLGDLNGDGVPDVLVGADADGDSADGAGAAYVLFLNTDGTVNTQQKISNGTGGLNSGTLSSFDRFGTSATEIGDLDNDGVSDVLIGALGDDDGANDAGAAYVLYMNTDGTVDTQQKISEDTGSLAANLDELDFFGTSAAGLGDLDGNGVPDVLVGASGDDDGADGAGAAYVLFLNADGTVNTQQKISDGTGGLASGTLGSFNSFGSSATSVGDLDADGVSDILVGVPGDNDGASSAGATYVLFLNADGTVNAQQKISDGTGGFPTGTLASEDRFGESVAEIGDLNGDGIPDVLVGANEDDSRDGAGQVDAGTAYALFLDGSETCTNGPNLLSFEAIGVDIDFASGTAGSGCITASRFDDAPTDTQNIPSENNVSDYRVVISSDASLNVGTNTEVRLDVNRFGGINTPDNVTVYARPDVGSGAFNALPTSDESAGGTTEIVAQVDGFSEFVLASPTDPLPIELQELTVQQSNRRAQVQWSTASETNNAGFYVQTQSLSADSTTTESAWTTLGFVEGAGTTDAPQSYQFETDKLPYGAHAFRLRQVDTDGTETTTDPVTVEVQLDRAYVVEAPYPNPSRGQATLPVTVRETQRVQVALYDMLGRRISTVHDGEVPSQDTESIQLDTGQLASGTYFVRVRGEDFTTTERLTVVR